MLQAYNTAETTYSQNDIVIFTKTKYDDSRITYTPTSFMLKSSGRYLVQFYGVGSSSTADTPFTVQLFANDIAVPEATSTTTPGAAGEQNSLSFATIINVPRSCCVVNSNTTLHIEAVSAVAGALTNANIIITKLR